MEELSHLTVICENRDEDVFWDSAFFWKVVWKPDGVYIIKVVYRGKKSFIIESFG